MLWRTRPTLPTIATCTCQRYPAVRANLQLRAGADSNTIQRRKNLRTHPNYRRFLPAKNLGFFPPFPPLALAERLRHNLYLIRRILRAESVFAPESTSRRSSTRSNFQSSTSWNLTVGFTGCTARILYIARCSILTSSADQSDFTRGIGGGIWVKIL
ncbi:uncharacterized protein LOC131222527 isoform X2 [Magnolia sinica]|uniref:uncharacterized protein LOC131222527 isoform X2 n=1 Tax=Magnolia sinica TaxID=86752 RepID=UPI0026596E46|nr:uncharacterized protein LOC131222527 isoform X2 [Magnolia sinica]